MLSQARSVIMTGWMVPILSITTALDPADPHPAQLWGHTNVTAEERYSLPAGVEDDFVIQMVKFIRILGTDVELYTFPFLLGIISTLSQYREP